MHDLSPFIELKQRKRVPWDERLELARAEFPAFVEMEWREAFNDIDLLGRVLRDILKTDQAEKGRSGPRPELDRRKAQARLRQYMGRDYTDLLFPESFRVLSRGLSHRQLAEKIGIDRNMVQKLMAGTKQPDLYFMEQIAQSFDKYPSYFLEYRMLYVLSALASEMQDAPEISVDLYQLIKGRHGDH